MKETAPACSRHQRGLPARPPLPEQLLPRLQMKGPTSLPSPAGPPPRYTTYPGTAAWPPWTGASSPPGSCLCPARAGWAAPSPQSAGGALGRGHTCGHSVALQRQGLEHTRMSPGSVHSQRLLAPQHATNRTALSTPELQARHICPGPKLLQPTRPKPSSHLSCVSLSRKTPPTKPLKPETKPPHLPSICRISSLLSIIVAMLARVTICPWTNAVVFHVVSSVCLVSRPHLSLPNSKEQPLQTPIANPSMALHGGQVRWPPPSLPPGSPRDTTPSLPSQAPQKGESMATTRHSPVPLPLPGGAFLPLYQVTPTLLHLLAQGLQSQRACYEH